MDRVIALVDMDCFYVQVEQRIHPETKGLPCAVVQYKKWKGGGIIAVGYEARAKGVTRNMWGDDAKAKCPNIHFFRVPEVRGKADLTKFREAGAEVIAVLSKFSNCVERASVDEAYIDLTEEVRKRITSTDTDDVLEQLPNTFVVGWGDDKDGSKRKQGMSEWMKLLPCTGSNDNADQKLLIGALIAEEMRAAVYKETGFSCSAGISYNKMLAKLACGLHKPNKQTILPHSSVQQLFDTLPITKIRNLGGKLGHAVIEQLTIQNIGQLCQYELHTLQQNFGDKTGAWLYDVCRGIEHEPVSARQLPKSIGCSKNFPGKTCLDTKEKVRFWLLELSKEVEERLIKDRELNNRLAKSMTVSVRYLSDPSPVVASRACAISRYDAEKFANDAYALIMKLNNAPAHQSAWSPPILCLGVSATKFQEESSSQSTLNMLSFVGQKTLCSGSASQSPVSPAPQIKPKTKTIDNFFFRGNDTLIEPDHCVGIDGPHQISTECEQVDSSVNFSYRSIQSTNNENWEEQDILQLPEEEVLTTEYSSVKPNPVINGKKGNVNGFFARRNYQHGSVSNLPRELTLVESQEKEKTDTPGGMGLNGVNCYMKKNVISQNSVDPDFLAALPPDLRQEILSQVSCAPFSPVGNQCNAPRSQEQRDKTSLEKFLTRQDSSVLYAEDSQKTENLVTCDRCNKQVEKSELTEHLDFHFAKELQKELTWTSDKSSDHRKRSMGCSDTSSKNVVTKKFKNNSGQTQTISQFFNKKSS